MYRKPPQVFDLHNFAIVCFVIDGFVKLVFASIVVEADDHLRLP